MIQARPGKGLVNAQQHDSERSAAKVSILLQDECGVGVVYLQGRSGGKCSFTCLVEREGRHSSLHGHITTGSLL